MQPKIRIVHCHAVTKVRMAAKPPVAVFGDMTVTLPTDRIGVVLGHQGSGRSTFLRLICGAERPDYGEVLTQTRFSVISNAKSYFHPMLTGIENIALVSRMYGIDADALTAAAFAAPAPAGSWYDLVGSLSAQARRAMEITVAALLPFDCYLLDDVERVDPEILEWVVQVVRVRRAGMIVAAHNPKIVRPFVDFVAVIAYQTVYAFTSMREALDLYGRQPI
jgi:capsular polysaccharide transport system ATP-binding protein